MATFYGRHLNYVSAMEKDKVAHVEILALIISSQNLEDLGRGLEGDDRLEGGGGIRMVSQGPNRFFIKREAHLDGKVRLIPKLASETVTRELANHVQTILGKIIAELFVQSLLSAQVM